MVGLAISAACAGPLRAQNVNRKAIVGRLWVGSSPGAHMTVVLDNQYGNPVGQTVSDMDGRFSFDGLNGETYRLQVNEPGFVPLEQTVDLSSSGDEANVSLFLRRSTQTVRSSSLGPYSLSAKAMHAYTQAQKLIAQRDYKKAIAPLTATVAAAPTFAEGYTQLGNAYWATGHRDSAEKSWRKALQLDAHAAEAAINLARLENDRHQWPAALALLNQAEKDAHGVWPWHLERGRSEYGLQRWAQAGSDLEASLPAGGKADPSVYVLISNLDIKAGQLPQARHMLETYLQAAPQGALAARAREIVREMTARGVPEPQ